MIVMILRFIIMNPTYVHVVDWELNIDVLYY